MQFDLNGKKHWLNINHLYYFYIIVNEGSLAKASETLLVGPPSLSSQIKQLENHLGLELFERKNKKLKMTPKGEIVYNYADSLFKIAHDLVEAISVRQSEEKKQLRIGVPESISNNAVLSLCKTIINDQTFSINIKNGKTPELLNELKGKQIDMMFVNTNIPKVDGAFNLKKIMSSPLVICGSKKYSKLAENFPASLRGAPFMLSLPESKIRTGMEVFLKKHELKIELIGETKDMSMQRIFATEGLALIVAPLSSVQDLIDSKELVELGRPDRLTEELFLLSSASWNDQAVSKKAFADYKDL